MTYRSSVPVIATADVRGTLDYYIRVFGFAEHFVYGDPPVYAGLERDGVLLYVTLDEALANLVKTAGVHPEVFLWVHEIDVVYATHVARGAKVVEPLANRPWDARQYVVEDPNGYWLKISEPLDAA